MSRAWGRLTGRVRGRPGWFGRVVLQVEVYTLRFKRWGVRREDFETHWRDATSREIAAIGIVGAAAEPEIINPSPRCA